MPQRPIDINTAQCIDVPTLHALLQLAEQRARKRDSKRLDIEHSDSFLLLQRVQSHMRHLLDHGASSVADLRLGEVRLTLLDEDRIEPLTSYEQVQIATLKPGSVDEACAYLPSLRRFSTHDLEKLLAAL